MRLALYAHYGPCPQVARYVLHYVRHLRALGFETCFVSNSPLSRAGESEIAACCHRVILRDNLGFDFSMWQQGLSAYDLRQVDELLLTNSSIIGPLSPLATLWQNSRIKGCDFWGLTDNCELSPHLQSYFLVFGGRVIQSDCFARFWDSVLPYAEKDQVIRSYEVGLTRWLEQNGFAWASVFPQRVIRSRYTQRYGFLQRVRLRIERRRLPRLNTTLCHPELLIEAGMPFLKTSLLHADNHYLCPRRAYALLEASALPAEILSDLRPDLQKAT